MDVNLPIAFAKSCPLLPIHCNLAIRIFFIRKPEFRNNRITVLADNFTCCRVKFTIDWIYAILFERLPIQPLYICKLLFQVVFSVLEVPRFFHALTAIRVYLVDYLLEDFSELYCLAKRLHNRLS